jgi:hypothetical protein
MDNYSISLIMEKYDNNIQQNAKLYKILDKCEKDYYNNVKKVIFKNKDKEYIYQYEILGSYYSGPKIWAWAWGRSLAGNVDNLSKKLLLYGLNLNFNKLNNDLLMIRTLLITSRITITDDIQLDIFTALGSYLTGITKIYPVKRKIYDGSYIINYLFLMDSE